MNIIRDLVKKFRMCAQDGKNRMKDADNEDFFLLVYLYSVNKLSRILDQIHSNFEKLSKEQQDFLAWQFAETCSNLVSSAKENSKKFGGTLYNRFSGDLEPTKIIDTVDAIKFQLFKNIEPSHKPGYIITPPNEIQ